MDLDACRVCLQNGAKYNLFSPKSMRCRLVITDLFRLSVSREDGLPEKICRKCHSKLASTYRLKRSAEKSYSKLLNLKRQLKVEETDDSVKVEDDNSSNFENENENSSNFENENEYMSDVDVENSAYIDTVDSIKEEDSFDEYDEVPLIYLENESRTDSTEKDLNSKGLNDSKKNKLRLGYNVCDLCGKRVSNLKQHRKLHDNNKKRISCTFCPKTFSTFGGRNKHVSIHHLGILYYCEICKKYYKRGYEHKRAKHSNIPKQFECVHCKKDFLTRGLLNVHMKSHTKEKPYNCLECGKAFRTRALSVYHIRRVHERRKDNICQYCSKAFYSSQHLKIHVRIHTKERNYKCKECEKCFVTGSALKVHERRHTGIKNILCTLCNMAFIDNGALKIHMVSHTKEKNYECKYCGIKFGRSDHRNRHQKTAHEKSVELNPYIKAASLID